MKLYLYHSRKCVKILLLVILAAVPLISAAGCSSGDSRDRASSEQSEIDQLKEENERLRRELELALATVEKATAENENQKAEAKQSPEDKEESEEVRKDQMEPPQATAEPVNITPPRCEPAERLAGEWFYHDFHEDGFFSWIQSIIFAADGTGTMNRTYYVPQAEAEDYLGTMENLDVALGLSWTLANDALHIVLDTGESADFIFSPDEQQLVLTNGNDKYTRERPVALENYVERCLFAESGVAQARKDLIKRSFLGTWYFDVLTWTFNEDGTGIIDIPEAGDQPATTREFSYTVTVDVDGTAVAYVSLMIDWSDADTSYFWPVINNDGSIILEGVNDSGSIKLTRTFDIDNCPMSEALIAKSMGVFTGSIFADILPGY